MDCEQNGYYTKNSELDFGSRPYLFDLSYLLRLEQETEGEKLWHKYEILLDEQNRLKRQRTCTYCDVEYQKLSDCIDEIDCKLVNILSQLE